MRSYILVQCDSQQAFGAIRRAIHAASKEGGFPVADLPYSAEKRTMGLSSDQSWLSWNTLDTVFATDMATIKVAVAEYRKPKLYGAMCGKCDHFAVTFVQKHSALRRFLIRKGWKVRKAGRKVWLVCNHCADNVDTPISVFDPDFRKIWKAHTFQQNLITTTEGKQ